MHYVFKVAENQLRRFHNNNSNLVVCVSKSRTPMPTTFILT